MQKPFEEAAFGLKVAQAVSIGGRDVFDRSDGFGIPFDSENRMRIIIELLSESGLGRGR